MKNHRSYWFLAFVLLLSSSIKAEVDSYVGAYANIGEWTMLPSRDGKFGPSLGGAGGFGALYELQVGPMTTTTRFLLDVGVGMTGGITCNNLNGTIEVPLAGQKDLLDQEDFTYVYSLQKRRDQYSDIAINVPLMVGVQHKKFYILAGVKLYYHAWTKVSSQSMLNTFGLYENLPDMRNMKEYQFFENRPLASSFPTKLNLDVDLSFEIGGRLGLVANAVGFDVPKRETEYRLAAFVDYGLLDLHKDMKDTEAQYFTTAEKYDTDPASANYVYRSESMVNGDALKMHDIMSTTGFASKVSNLMVGLKFTILFQMPSQGIGVINRDGYRKSTPRYRGRRGMKYEE